MRFPIAVLLCLVLVPLALAQPSRFNKTQLPTATPFKDESNTWTLEQLFGGGLRFSSTFTPSVNGQAGWDATNFLFRQGGINRKLGYGDLVLRVSTIADSSAISNSSAENTFNQSGTLGAGSLAVSGVADIRASGKISTKTGTGGEAITLKVKIGSTTIGTFALTLPNGVSNVGWDLQVHGNVRTVGSSGTVSFNGIGVARNTTTNTAADVASSTNAGTSTINTTIDNTVSVTAQWTNADATNTITLENLEATTKDQNGDVSRGGSFGGLATDSVGLVAFGTVDTSTSTAEVSATGQTVSMKSDSTQVLLDLTPASVRYNNNVSWTTTRHPHLQAPAVVIPGIGSDTSAYWAIQSVGDSQAYLLIGYAGTTEPATNTGSSGDTIRGWIRLKVARTSSSVLTLTLSARNLTGLTTHRLLLEADSLASSYSQGHLCRALFLGPPAASTAGWSGDTTSPGGTTQGYINNSGSGTNGRVQVRDADGFEVADGAGTSGGAWTAESSGVTRFAGIHKPNTVAPQSAPSINGQVGWSGTKLQVYENSILKDMVDGRRELANGRLTLTSGSPVSDASGAMTIYWTPYDGNRIAIYSGTLWEVYTFSETSEALGTLSNNTNYDVFAFINGGVVDLEIQAWNSSTARHASGTYSVSLPTQDGVKVKSTNGTAIDATRRFLGTFRTTTTTTTEDSVTKRFVSNYYNRRPRLIDVDGANLLNTTSTSIQDLSDTFAHFVTQGDQAVIATAIVHMRAGTNTGGYSGFLLLRSETPGTLASMDHSFTTVDSGVDKPTTLHQNLSVTAGYHSFNVGVQLNAANSTSFVGPNMNVYLLN